MCMFFKLYVVLTFFSLAGLLMWYKFREIRTKKKLRDFQNSILKYHGKKDNKEKSEKGPNEGRATKR